MKCWASTGSVVTVFLYCLVSMASVHADDYGAVGPERGRLPDGRAFRTDADGAQLVDYIAELEINILELNRKILSLEDENVTIKANLERVEAGRTERLVEKDLLKSASPQVEASDEEVLKADFVLKSEVNNSHATQQNESINQSPEIKVTDGILPDLKAHDCETLLKPVNAKIVELELKLKNQGQPQHPANMRASMMTVMEESPHNSLESVRAELKQDLRTLLARKDERDISFKKYVTEKQGVGLQPSSLRSKSGRDLKQLEELIAKASTVRELSLLKIDLEGIRRQMADDLALVDRMSKL